MGLEIFLHTKCYSSKSVFFPFSHFIFKGNFSELWIHSLAFHALFNALCWRFDEFECFVHGNPICRVILSSHSLIKNVLLFFSLYKSIQSPTLTKKETNFVANDLKIDIDRVQFVHGSNFVSVFTHFQRKWKSFKGKKGKCNRLKWFQFSTQNDDDYQMFYGFKHLNSISWNIEN